MKAYLQCFSIISCVSSLMIGCGGDSSSPDTLTRDKLSPPLKLVTVTGDQSVELRWSAQNFESELQGYDVFMIEDSSLASIAAGTAFPKYPTLATSGAALQGASIPRCKENNPFFNLLGITVDSDEACESSGLLGLRSADGIPSSTALLEEAAKKSILDAKLTCYDPANPDTALGNSNVSLPKADGEYQDGQGIQRCLIKQNTAAAQLQNGKTYVFVVFAVLGSKFDEISWSSNLAEDTPAKPVFSDSVSLAAGQYQALTLSAAAPFDSAATLGTATTCPGSNLCNVNGTNTVGSDGAIYFARDTGGTYPQRLFLSTKSGGNIKLLYRGPLTLDPVLGSGTIATRVPGDEAVSTTTGSGAYLDGSTIAIYDNSVIDFAYTVSGSTYYGKLIVDAITYPDGSSGAANFKLTAILQSKAGSTAYFH